MLFPLINKSTAELARLPRTVIPSFPPWGYLKFKNNPKTKPREFPAVVEVFFYERDPGSDTHLINHPGLSKIYTWKPERHLAEFIDVQKRKLKY
eukprot:snap_masked-scaffold_38-processed-gene-0.30-mRNA-1 protein AED:1.00 eAED:1.00 QI:0/-1/0/0/-1/1/1/0/93